MSNISIEKGIQIPKSTSRSPIPIEKGLAIPESALLDKRKNNNLKMFVGDMEVGDSFLFRTSDSQECCAHASGLCGRNRIKFPDREYKWGIWNHQVRIWRTK